MWVEHVVIETIHLNNIMLQKCHANIAAQWADLYTYGADVKH